MTRCLVTGGGGFLGQYIVEQLIARGDKVRSLSRTRHEVLERIGAEHIQGDVRDAETVSRACEGMDVVYHVAAVAGIWGPWQRYHSINTQGHEERVAGLHGTQSASTRVFEQSECDLRWHGPMQRGRVRTVSIEMVGSLSAF